MIANNYDICNEIHIYIWVNNHLAKIIYCSFRFEFFFFFSNKQISKIKFVYFLFLISEVFGMIGSDGFISLNTHIHLWN